MTTQVAEIWGGVVLMVVLAVLAGWAMLHRDEYGGPGCFVWAVGFVLFLAAGSLFTAAGVQ